MIIITNFRYCLLLLFLYREFISNTYNLFFSFILFPQSFEQFEFFGCDNCEEYLGMKNNREMVYDCTSNNFDG